MISSKSKKKTLKYVSIVCSAVLIILLACGIYLNDYYNASIGGNNLMLRIADNKRVQVDNCIEIKENVAN